ncbi:hypothetical protein HK098_002388 [Nowakowskiella sp. JEL0407]|nr:hypothetical protein HK098_002388 [Nowakowskiella sp. JEL0407]
MSLKGLTKAIARLPQLIASKTGNGDDDPVYVDLETRFKKLDSNMKRLNEDAKKFKDAMTAMLDHQHSMASTFAEFYGPIVSSGTPVTNDATSQDYPSNVRGFDSAAPQQTIDRAKELSENMIRARDTLLPDLDVIERRIIMPTTELLAIFSSVKKLMVKRDHKRLDFDRHTDGFKKLKERSDRDVKDEKKMAQIEIQLDLATREYNALNDLLVQQLPMLLELAIPFVDPCFKTLYWYQLKAHHSLYKVFYGTLANKTNLEQSVLSGFEKSFVDVEQMFDGLSILKRNQAKLGVGTAAIVGQTSGTNAAARTISPTDTGYGSGTSPDEISPPPYAPNQGTGYGVNKPAPTFAEIHAASNPWSTPAPSTNPWSAASPATTSTQPKYVVALYDYNADNNEDLSFRRDDKIEVVQRTADTNDWWTGRLNGKVGAFPANYTAEL